MHSTSHPTDVNFAERLRFWRTSQNLTQAEAAGLLDIDRSYLSQVERRRRPGNAWRTRFQLIEQSSSVRASGNVTAASYNLRNVPILSWAQARQARDFEEIPGERAD